MNKNSLEDTKLFFSSIFFLLVIPFLFLSVSFQKETNEDDSFQKLKELRLTILEKAEIGKSFEFDLTQ